MNSKKLLNLGAHKIVYDTNNPHIVTNVKNQLKNSLWYSGTDGTTADTNTGFEARKLLTQAANDDGTGGSKDFSRIIPLNHYSLFEELGDKVLPPMQLLINFVLQQDMI